MQLTLHTHSGALLVRAHEPGAITIGERVLRAPFVLSGQAIIEDWPMPSPGQLGAEDARRLLALSPEIVLLGMPAPVRWPPAALRGELGARRVGLEVMEIGAACRTYNVLVQEDRKVAAIFHP